jgi:predicted nucleic acid-binding protein
MAVLVDTNVLLRVAEPGHASHVLATDSLARFRSDDEPLHVTPQNIAELWNVMTRPLTNNGLGFPIAVAQAEVAKIEELFELLQDTPEIYDTWKRLVVEHRVIGSKVHDARIVAAMQVHRVDRILTFDAGDFARYGVEVLDPATLS